MKGDCNFMKKAIISAALILSISFIFGCTKKEEQPVSKEKEEVKQEGMAEVSPPAPPMQAPDSMEAAKPSVPAEVAKSHPPMDMTKDMAKPQPSMETTPPHPTGAKEKAIVVPDEVKKKWKTVSLKFIADGKESPLTVKVGEMVNISGTTLSIKAEAFLPDYSIEMGRITTKSNEPKNPAVLVELFDKGKSIAKGWVFERLPDFNSYQHEKYRIVLLPEKKG